MYSFRHIHAVVIMESSHAEKPMKAGEGQFNIGTATILYD